MIPSGINRQFDRQFNSRKCGFSRYPFLQIFRFFYNCLWNTANAILFITYIRSTFITDQTKFIEDSQNCKWIDEFRDIQNMQTRPQAPKPIFLGLESEKYENWIPTFVFWKYIKDAPKKTVQNGCDAFPNEFTRFRFEATPMICFFENN